MLDGHICPENSYCIQPLSRVIYYIQVGKCCRPTGKESFLCFPVQIRVTALQGSKMAESPKTQNHQEIVPFPTCNA